MLLIEEICMDITVVTKSYGRENSWAIGSCSSSQRYSSFRTYTERCCLAPGEHTLACSDSYGDGWHGGHIEIQGTEYCKNFRRGREASVDINVIGT